MKREVPHESIPGITLYKDHELMKLAEKLRNVFNEIGQVLSAGGYENMAFFVLDVLKRNSSAEYLVESLVKAFPCMQDMHCIGDQGKNSIFALTLFRSLYFQKGTISCV
jgi:hydroxymethylpyrimidine pyrophosphatase-like HAD family hydrolase